MAKSIRPSAQAIEEFMKKAPADQQGRFFEDDCVAGIQTAGAASDGSVG